MVKLLLVAPTCDGQDVGEAWVAFQWARLGASRQDVTVLTYHKQGRAPLSHQLPGVRVIEWAEPPGLGRAERINSMLKPGYIPFYFRARQWIKAALARGEHFDLAHQPVPVAARYPSPAAGLGLPLVMGPVGGSLASPAGFAEEEGTTPWYVGLRRLDRLRLAHDPWLRNTYRQADCVIGIAPYVRDLLAGIPLRRFAVMSETGLEQLPDPTARPHRDEVRLLYVGRLVRTKGARDAIRALGLMPGLPVVLDVVGDGPDRAACQELAGQLGLGDRVRFHGWLPRQAVAECYQQADVFVFPSYREPGGNVTFEAMGHGLPMVVSDLGGPGNVVDDTCGIRVPPVSPQQYARDLAAAITRLVRTPALRQELGAGARRRASEIGLWESRAEKVEEIYSAVLAARDGSRRLGGR